MSRSRPVVAAAAAALAVLAAVPRADALPSAWGTPTTIPTTAYTAPLDVRPDGDAISAWIEQGFSLRVAIRDNGVWSGAHTLAPGNAYAGAAALTSGGAVAVWSAWDGADYDIRWSSFDGVIWSASMALDNNVGNFYVAISPAPDGSAYAVWTASIGGFSRVRVARYAGGVWSPAETISPAGVSSFYPQLDVRPDGQATVSWTASNLVQARTSVAGSFDGTATFDLSSGVSSLYDVAAGPEGTVAVVFYDSGGIYLRVRSGGAWQPSQAVAPADTYGGAHVAVDRDSRVMVVWTRQQVIPFPQDLGAYARVRAADGSLGAIRTLEEASSAGQTHVDAHPAGGFTVAWKGYVAASGMYRARVEREQAGVWTTGPDITEPTAVHAVTPAYDQFGALHVAWTTGSAMKFVASVPVPPAPPIGVVAGVSGTTASVSFAAPLDQGGAPVMSYTATCTPVSGGAASTASGGGAPLSVGGLAAGTTYTCAVAATNSAGTGAPSAPSAEFTTAAAGGGGGGGNGLVPFACQVGAAAPFTDIGGSFAAAQIACLYAAGLVSGTSATTYGPGNVVTREQMAIFLMNAFEEATGVPYAGPTADFSDIASSFAADRIRQLAGLEITSGCATNLYCPVATVTREQMAVFLVRLYEELTGTTPTPAPDGTFTDVAASFAKDRILQLVGLGVTAGTSPTTYGPGNVVTREQMAVFLVNRLEAAT